MVDPVEHGRGVAARDRRAESNARRLVSAVSALGVVSGMVRRGLAPPPKLIVVDAG